MWVLVMIMYENSRDDGEEGEGDLMRGRRCSAVFL